MRYRIGMIAAGAGALFLAAWLGSHEQAYVYRAWQQTYLIMAAVMGVGVATTLFTREPDSSRAATAARPAADNFRLLLLFACAVGAFVAALSALAGCCRKAAVCCRFLLESLRLLLVAVAAAAVVRWW